MSTDETENADNELSPRADEASPYRGETSDTPKPLSIDETETTDHEQSSRTDLPGSGHPSPTLEDSTTGIEAELQEVAQSLNESENIIVFVGAGISTSCGIPVSAR